ncbi:3,4-dihydroxy-2-butanone-4-phosphate synthase [Rhodococcus sp. NCIMB 12038]|uniref:3,4-dihydroxy-2-butanone-4-phosphate synthase n=1 Tax=Rhodococcus sp. NCIMB 12038 TaxID=933800 RepID=UPI0015C58CBE|nr:3,4-dihydroxy-2-butanone-4-phosphate synthase [Rhodococcus sp. NCIMB 12038]
MTTTLRVAPSVGSYDVDSAKQAVEAMAGGGLIVIADGTRAVLACCAATATTATLDVMIRHTSGFVQVALPEETCDTLLIPQATPSRRRHDTSSFGQCVAVDAASAVTTGISAADRATTARVLADPSSTHLDLVRPGHVVPVCIAPKRHRIGSTVASLALDLSVDANSRPGAVFADIVSTSNPLNMADYREARGYAVDNGFPFVAVRDRTYR